LAGNVSGDKAAFMEAISLVKGDAEPVKELQSSSLDRSHASPHYSHPSAQARIDTAIAEVAKYLPDQWKA
jgi:hypothetical protein